MRGLLALTFIFLLVGCNKEKLQDLQMATVLDNEKGSLKANFCTTPSDKVKSRLKFIFVLDKSGSNKEADPARPGSVASDPTGDKRYLPIKSFIASNPDPIDASDKSIGFALVNLSTAANIRSSPTFMQKGPFSRLINDEHNPPGSTTGPLDAGATNYTGALAQVFTIISNDITAAKNETALTGKIVSSYYIVFFVTDGAPMVGGVMQSEADIVAKVKAIKGIEETDKNYIDAVQVNAAYYYQALPDADAKSLLGTMSQPTIGAGMFIEFGAGQQIDFTKFAVPERNVRHVLKDIFVVNKNTQWINGLIDRDSDMDGLSDRNEIRLNSDPFKADSDENGVSDGIEHYTLGRPCKDANCSKAVGAREVFPQCDSIIEGRDRDIDGDGLTNCEEKILGTRWTSFDSNGDWIPDKLAFIRSVAFLSGTSDVELDTDHDGVRNYDEVKYFTPIEFENGKIIGLAPYKYQLVKTFEDMVKSCYRVDVTEITVTNQVDTLQLVVIEGSSALQDRQILRTVERTIDGQKRVEFEEADLK